ncbi:MAG: oligosaccharide flippase family protein [Candidatus Aminicenantia bacterium]
MEKESLFNLEKKELKEKIFVGGSFLFFRQGLSIFISLVGVIILTRLIGPTNYGLYNAGMGIYLFIYYLGQLGINVYLVRRREIKDEVYNQAFTFLLASGSISLLISQLSIPLLNKWLRLNGFATVATIIFLCYPFSLLNIVPISILERALNYKRVALIELLSQVIYYLLGLPLAYLGLGVWAPVIGWWTQQISVLFLSIISAKYRPKLTFNLPLLKEMLNYGVSYSLSFWIWQLRNLVNPLIVGRFIGASGVGYVALTIRIVEILTFARNVAWRISIAVMGRLQKEKERILDIINEGMRLQLLAICTLVLLFSFFSQWIIPLFFGDKWLPILKILPFIALSYIVNSLFSLHSSALYTIAKNKEVAIFHVIHILLFGAGTYLLVPKIGIIGYGIGETIAFLSYFSIHLFVKANFSTPDYLNPLLWLFSFSLPLFHQYLGKFVFLSIFLAFLIPSSRREISKYLKEIHKLLVQQTNLLTPRRRK